MYFRTISTGLAGLGLLAAVACAQESGDTAQQAGADAADAAPAFTMDDVTAAPDEWRQVDPDNLLVFETNKGRIVIEMLPDVAPKTVEQFRAIAKSGDFDGTSFHRVIDDFMAQGGDIYSAKGRDSGLPNIPGEFTFRRKPSDMPMTPKGKQQEATQGLYKGFPIATQSEYLAEMTKDGSVDSWVLHCPGVVSTARTNDPNSANSQFFLMRYKADHLDKSYAAWGRAIEGLDVIRSIKEGPKPGGTPIEDPDMLEEAYMVSELPEDERPEVWVQKTDTQAWADKLSAAAQLDTDICNVTRVPAVIDE
ncbi:peptidylprolyl isomerase [Henriciella aquimarina]|uniref:peptidylprolyl isomerase n=1 Tax=Henriciella aquimarina TaxID=545261 RepID=UPI000A01A1DE|nr:peptidylprolyl isomerase [Henriciella aquimarina]